MKKILYLIPLYLFLTGCSNEKLIFDSPSNVYFPNKEVIYSWLRNINDTYVVNVPCKIVGNAPESPMTYKVGVVADKTTAVEGVHYAKLPETFRWETGKFEVLVPITIYNRDVQLAEKDFTLTLQLLPGADIGVNYDGNMTYSIVMTAQVVKPVYWDVYTLDSFFGTYSKKKHTIIVQLVGADFPESVKDYKNKAVYWQNIGLTVVRDYFVANPGIKDENGVVITTW